MDDQDEGETNDHWTTPERWDVVIRVLGLLVAIVACVGQFAR
ncbi:hypothetical protein [Streptantibioticus ferralitis]|uniref:Uncharacterized protein n=1 Tax=Streptantibioticus ferralitis TaxID=236510 RepID=A0ABT5YZ32_9ACTN|nr:hypothetical protein [Streptantibioticus ferralitis]MDF2256704.1 hypothetical protein [Streptantibioticus ferralitis]